MNVTDVLNRLSFQRALVLGLVIAGIYRFALYDDGTSKVTAITQSAEKIKILEEQIHGDQGKIDRAEVYKKEALKYGETLAKHLSRIPEKFNQSDLMRIVSNEAKVAGSSSSISTGEIGISTMASNFEEMTVTVDLTGSFMQHMVFLSNLTKINQILVVRNFDLTESATPSAEGTMVKMTATVVAYRYLGDAKPATDKPVNQ